MIPIDRQTLTLIAVIICMVGLILMFKELRTAKEDVEGLKGFSMNVMKRMQPQPMPVRVPAPQPVRVAPPAPAPEKEKEEEEEVVEEKSEDK